MQNIIRDTNDINEQALYKVNIAVFILN